VTALVNPAEQRLRRDHTDIRGGFGGDDLDRSDLRSRRPHRVLDREFQGHRGGRTALAAASELQTNDIVDDVEQRYVTAVRAQVWPNAVKGVLDPALHIVRMQAVHQQQAGHQVVRGEPFCQLRVGAHGDAQHPLEAGPVKVGHLTDQLHRPFVGGSATRRGRVDQGLDPIARHAPLRVVLGLLRAWQCWRGHTLFPGDGLGGGVQ
jgi:hypothetical protein